MINLIPFKPADLNRGLDIISAQILAIEGDMRLPVSRSNRGRMREKVRVLTSVAELLRFNLTIMEGGREQHH